MVRLLSSFSRWLLTPIRLSGVGLNLTRANNVISLDLGWSRAVESQAWDRVHRLGQTRPVNVQRLVITETVEDRIMALQERKVSSPAQVIPRKTVAYLRL